MSPPVGVLFVNSSRGCIAMNTVTTQAATTPQLTQAIVRCPEWSGESTGTGRSAPGPSASASGLRQR